MEGVDDVPASCLVDQLEGDLVSEGPLENVVKLSFHDHKEQRHVTVLTDTVTIQIHSEAHLVSLWARVEGNAIHRSVSAPLGIGQPLMDLQYLPYHSTVSCLPHEYE